MPDDEIPQVETVQDAMVALGCPTKAALARALGVSRQNLQYWGETVPELRRYQIRELARIKKAHDALNQ